MITVIFYGLDQYIVGRLSRELTPKLAKLYEVDDEEVVFVSSDNMIFHMGVEQTSWNVLMHVHAPRRAAIVQDEVAKYLLNSIGEIAIHKIVEFYYYHEENRYENINEEYPRFIDESNLDNDDYEDYDETDVYTGDIFKEGDN